jgi:type VI secretion system secreted protein Hcp
MAYSICIKIGKDKWIKGDSSVSKHEKEIDVLEWSWGLTQSATSHIATGAGAGSADVRDLTIKKYLDSATPNLIQACFFGDDHAEAILTVIKSGGSKGPIEMVKMTMSGTVFLSSVNTGLPGPNDTYLDIVTLNFAKVKFEYTGQNADQSKGATVSGEFDIAKRH